MLLLDPSDSLAEPDSLADPTAPGDEVSDEELPDEELPEEELPEEELPDEEVSEEELPDDALSNDDKVAELDEPEPELGAVAVPPVELQPARSSTAPASAAVKVVRLIRFLSTMPSDIDDGQIRARR